MCHSTGKESLQFTEVGPLVCHNNFVQVRCVSHIPCPDSIFVNETRHDLFNHTELFSIPVATRCDRYKSRISITSLCAYHGKNQVSIGLSYAPPQDQLIVVLGLQYAAAAKNPYGLNELTCSVVKDVTAGKTADKVVDVA